MRYFGLTTLTTVGFGDITPITAQGRLVVAASILAGAAVFPIQLSKLAEAFMTSKQRTQEIQEIDSGFGLYHHDFVGFSG